MKKFYFTIIMAVYDAERYIEEAIESVVNQTIGFDKIQLILVNDGSPDDSNIICEKYAEKYPKNILYLEQENQGVSAARNHGLEYAKGEYVNCLDSDDILEKTACEKVYQLYQSNKNEMDVVSIPLIFFEGRTGNHVLNFKFQKTRVIDLNQEPENIQLSNSSAFIRRSAIGSARYNQKLKYGEDAEFINKIILQKLKLGVISDTCYHYRFRASNNSAMQSTELNKEIYTPVIEYFYKSIINESLKKYQKVVPYIQQVILYDLKWKVVKRQSLSGAMTEFEIEEFINKLSKALYYIEDESILTYKNFGISYKLVEYSIKYGHNAWNELNFIKSDNDIYIVYQQLILAKLSTQVIRISTFCYENGKVYLSGRLGSLLGNQSPNIYVVIENENDKIDYPVQNISLCDDTICAFDQEYAKGYAFDIPQGIKIKGTTKLYFEIEMEGIRVKTKITPLPSYGRYRSGYLLLDQYLVSIEGQDIVIEPITKDRVAKKEQKFLEDLSKNPMLREEQLDIIKEKRKRAIELKENKKNPQWVFLDRINMADDNAEHLFRYATQQDDGIEKYFILPKDSKDYKRVASCGTVIEPFSREHEDLMFTADMVISSGADQVIWNPLEAPANNFCDGFMCAKRIFLQHGVTKDNLSGWLAKHKKRLRGFVTTSAYEQESILTGGYGYREDEVWNVGFPRFDHLRDETEKYIAYMPTWNSRYSILKDGKAIYNPNFKNTSLFQEIQDVLGNEELLNKIQESGYKLWFKPHPNLVLQLDDFVISDGIELVPPELTYQDIFAKAAVLITDYSSVFFDFAYLKKPVLYYHVRTNHLQKGYFDYETMGFGKVAHDIDTLSKNLEEVLEQDAQMDAHFVGRVEAFFAHLDQNNCVRVYNRLLKIQKGGR